MVFSYYHKLSAAAKRVYRQSDGIHTVPLPHGAELQALIPRMTHALLEEDRAAVEELWPYALGVLPAEQRRELAHLVGLAEVDPVERGSHTDELAELWDEMTVVRRSAPAGSQW